MTERSLYASLAAVAMLLACASRASAQCQSDGDCRAGRVCRGGNCVNFSCTKDTDCPNDEICTAGSCKSAAVTAPPAAAPLTGTTLAPRPEAPLQRVSLLHGDRSIHQHFGFFIRLDVGGGYASGYESVPEGTLSVTGIAGTAGVNIGGAVVEDTILGVHFYAVVLSNPTASIGSRSASTTNTWYSLFSIGPSVTHYFMPANIYLTGTVAVTRLSQEINGRTYNANIGYGFRPAVGKDWWVTDHWGLGVSAHLTFSANQDTGYNAPTIVSLFYALVFSATYN